jgi:hypothetical protein
MQLIERESELSTLSTYLEDIRTGAGTLALVGGEAGAGTGPTMRRPTSCSTPAAGSIASRRW